MQYFQISRLRIEENQIGVQSMFTEFCPVKNRTNQTVAVFDLICDESSELFKNELPNEYTDWHIIHPNLRARIVIQDERECIEFQEVNPPQTQFGPKPCLVDVLPFLVSCRIISPSELPIWNIENQPLIQQRLHVATQRMQMERKADHDLADLIFSMEI